MVPLVASLPLIGRLIHRKDSDDLEKSTPVEGQEKTLKGRCCINWKAIAAAFTVATLILGIIYCLLWNKGIYSIPFAAGIITGLTSVYFAYHYEYLQSFAVSAVTLEKENKTLQETSGKLKEENDKYAELNTQLEETLKKAKTDQEELSSILTDLSKVLKGDAQEIKTSLEKYLIQIDSIVEKEKDTNATAQSVKDEMNSASSNLKSVLTQFSHLVSSSEVQNIMNLNKSAQETLNSTQDSLNKARDLYQKQLELSQSTITKLTATETEFTLKSKELAETSKKLEELKSRFSTTEKNLKEQVTRFKEMMDIVQVSKNISSKIQTISQKLDEAEKIQHRQQELFEEIKKTTNDKTKLESLIKELQSTSNSEGSAFNAIKNELKIVSEEIKQLKLEGEIKDFVKIQIESND